MSLNSIFQFFVPKDKVFFPLFTEAADTLIELATLLHEVVNLQPEERENHYLNIQKLEAKIEYLTHKTNLELSKNFITPFDREDVFALVKSMDYVSDHLNGAANRMRIYHVENITKSIRKLTEINLEACQLIGEAVKELKFMKSPEKIYYASEKINKLENKSDRVFDKAVAEIFENETDAKNIIKYKEVLSSLESAVDKCKSVANVLETIAVKQS